VSATPAPEIDARPEPDRAEPRTLYELFRQVTTSHPELVAFRVKRDGSWRDINWSDQAATVDQIARSLLALGVEKGDRVSVLSSTRVEWLQCDSAIVNIGAVTVGIYHSNLAPDCSYILQHSGTTVLFVEDESQLEKVLSVRSELADLGPIVVFDGESHDAAGVLSWAEFLERGRGTSTESIDERGRQIEPDDLASLVYTSGTTGLPKGAMITHENLVFTSEAATQAMHVKPGFTTLLFLPLAHVYARMIVYMCQRGAMTMAMAEDLSKVASNMRETRPEFICSVPRIYEKIQEMAMASADEAGGLKRKIFLWAVATGRQAARLRLAQRPVPAWLSLKHAIADRLVLHKVRAAFGDRLIWGASGAAPLNVEVNEFFQACGVAVLEGLGMTENTSLSNVNPIERNKLGSVGPAIPGTAMKIAEDGEILFRGPNTMKGYYDDPEATAETIDSDGWLHSGDIGEIDEDGYLSITDRKKELIVTAGGKNVAPQRVESTIGASSYIRQVVACGDRQKFIAALVTLNGDNIRRWAAEHGLGSKTVEELASEPDVRELIEAEIAERNRELASFESVKKFRILPRELSIAEGDLTPTLKVRRKVVREKHQELLREIYAE